MAGTGIDIDPDADTLTISNTGSPGTFITQQDTVPKEAATAIMDFAAGSVLTVTGAAGTATVTFEVLNWIGCSSGSPVYLDSLSHITGSYP